MQNAAALGYRRFGPLSSGNMGASVAACGSRADMDTFIMFKNISQLKITP
jgi:threonine synthase